MAEVGATIVEISFPKLMDYIIETSLYLLHSRHDINQFLAARPEARYRTVEEIHAAKKYHPVLDLFDLLVQGPVKPTDDPEYYRKLAAREDFQRAAVNLLAQNGLAAMRFLSVQIFPPTKEEVKSGKVDDADLPDQHAASRRRPGCPRSPRAGRIYWRRHPGGAGAGGLSLPRARSVPAGLRFRAGDASSQGAAQHDEGLRQGVKRAPIAVVWSPSSAATRRLRTRPRPPRRGRSMTRVQAGEICGPDLWSGPKTDCERGFSVVEDGRRGHVSLVPIRASRTTVKELVCEYTRTSGPLGEC